MKIRHRNRIRRPSLVEFSRRGPFGCITVTFTDENGKRVTLTRRAHWGEVATATFPEDSAPFRCYAIHGDKA